MASYATDPTTPAVAGDTQPRRIPPRRMLPLLAGITAIGPFALNIYVPSVPNIADALKTSVETVQLTITLYLLAIAAGQLTLGPLSDRLGRRPVLIGGMVVYLLGSIASMLAPDIWTLIVARIAQAFGGCAGLVLGRAIVRDVYDRDSSASMLGYVTTIMVLMPMCAPVIGGFMDGAFGWRSSFVLVAGLGALMLVLVLTSLPETRRRERPAGEIPPLRGDSLRLLGNRAFLGYTLCASLGAGTYFSFITGAPFLMVDTLGRPASEYGLWFIVLALGFMAGNFLSGRKAARVGLDRLLGLGAVIVLAGSVFAVAVALVLPLSPAVLFVPMIVVAFGNGFCTANGIAGAVSVDPRLAGAASGIAGALQMAVGALGTQIVGHVMTGTAMPMLLTILGFSVLLMLSWTILPTAETAPRRG